MRRFLTLLLIVVMGSLAACQPAVAPTAETIVETVVVTQIVEGEMVEVGYEPGGAPDTDLLAYVAPANRLVIKDAELDLLVADSDAAIANVTQLAVDSGGYIISSRTWFQGDFKYASLRLAVPSDTFESTLNTLRIFGQEVLSETASGQDVTAEYVDLDSRLTNLEATADRVRAFLDSAASVEESLAVSEELSALEQEIEQIKGQMRYFEGRAAFSTVTVLVTPERAPAATPVWSLGGTVENAAATLITVSQGAISALVWILIVPGPFLMLVGLILWALRRRQGKSPAPESQPGD